MIRYTVKKSLTLNHSTMTKATTIKLDAEVKAALDAENMEGETYSETVARLLGHSDGKAWTKAEIREIATQAFSEQLRQS